ncbi:LOW QUALITY PROTEIN: Hypothetical protein PHPALM_5868 [Phytophthora palmivora]|uniref:Ty3 transposon capsid-like protein domain-containing protein n=1 Tax=Phytophthora palmivora TaxID=4796 RepID=A0A2P4YGB3_9STRA|nr:LOW QUALITY PROTEIN: Hypothetical protein PHPALM_5868 [Phytophthora palmivora]
MAPTTRSQTQDNPTGKEGNQAELEAQLGQRAQIPRVLTGQPIFKGKRDEDVRQWLFQVETPCYIHEPASGWFLFWASRTPPEQQTWGQFTIDTLSHLEALNYQAVARQTFRQLHQVGDIEEYTKYSSLIFCVKNTNEVDQVSYNYDKLKCATQAYIKLQNSTSLSKAIDQAVSSMPSCATPPRSILSQAKNPFQKCSHKPGVQGLLLRTGGRMILGGKDFDMAGEKS